MIIVTKSFDSYRQSVLWYDTSQKIGHPKWFLKKNKIIYSKNRRSRVKVEKDLSSILQKSFYVIKLPHHSKKIDSIWHGNLNWNTNRSKTPLSSRLNPLIFGLSVVGYSAMSCFSAPTYLDKGYLPNSLENANFFFPFTTPVGLVASPREKRATMAHAMQAYLVSLGTCWWNDHYCFN